MFLLPKVVRSKADAENAALDDDIGVRQFVLDDFFCAFAQIRSILS